jgi:hypothetical protein
MIIKCLLLISNDRVLTCPQWGYVCFSRNFSAPKKLPFFFYQLFIFTIKLMISNNQFESGRPRLLRKNEFDRASKAERKQFQGRARDHSWLNEYCCSRKVMSIVSLHQPYLVFIIITIFAYVHDRNRAIPAWLHDVFLGYGNPGSAHYRCSFYPLLLLLLFFPLLVLEIAIDWSIFYCHSCDNYD